MPLLLSPTEANRLMLKFNRPVDGTRRFPAPVGPKSASYPGPELQRLRALAESLEVLEELVHQVDRDLDIITFPAPRLKKVHKVLKIQVGRLAPTRRYVS